MNGIRAETRSRGALWGVRLLLALGAASSACATLSGSGGSTVTLTYLGVAGWSVTDGTHTVLLDPYFSRPEDLDHPRSDEQAVLARTPARVDLVLVGHGHFDHALDAPTVARHTGALLMASEEVVQEALAAGVSEDKLLLVKGGEDFQLEGFSVRVIPSLHSAIGFANHSEVQTFAYLVRMGGHEILLFDTANFIERELAGLHPDVAVIATGAREKVYDYAPRLMALLGHPDLVLATHFDSLRDPPDQVLSVSARKDLDAFAREIRAASPGTRVMRPVPFRPLPLR